MPVTAASVLVDTKENVDIKLGVFVFDSVVSLERLCSSTGELECVAEIDTDEDNELDAERDCADDADKEIKDVTVAVVVCDIFVDADKVVLTLCEVVEQMETEREKIVVGESTGVAEIEYDTKGDNVVVGECEGEPLEVRVIKLDGVALTDEEAEADPEAVEHCDAEIDVDVVALNDVVLDIVLVTVAVIVLIEDVDAHTVAVNDSMADLVRNAVCDDNVEAENEKVADTVALTETVPPNLPPPKLAVCVALDVVDSVPVDELDCVALIVGEAVDDPEAVILVLCVGDALFVVVVVLLAEEVAEANEAVGEEDAVEVMLIVEVAAVDDVAVELVLAVLVETIVNDPYVRVLLVVDDKLGEAD